MFKKCLKITKVGLDNDFNTEVSTKKDSSLSRKNSEDGLKLVGSSKILENIFSKSALFNWDTQVRYFNDLEKGIYGYLERIKIFCLIFSLITNLFLFKVLNSKYIFCNTCVLFYILFVLYNLRESKFQDNIFLKIVLHALDFSIILFSCSFWINILSIGCDILANNVEDSISFKELFKQIGVILLEKNETNSLVTDFLITEYEIDFLNFAHSQIIACINLYNIKVFNFRKTLENNIFNSFICFIISLASSANLFGCTHVSDISGQIIQSGGAIDTAFKLLQIDSKFDLLDVKFLFIKSAIALRITLFTFIKLLVAKQRPKNRVKLLITGLTLNIFSISPAILKMMVNLFLLVVFGFISNFSTEEHKPKFIAIIQRLELGNTFVNISLESILNVLGMVFTGIFFLHLKNSLKNISDNSLSLINGKSFMSQFMFLLMLVDNNGMDMLGGAKNSIALILEDNPSYSIINSIFTSMFGRLLLFITAELVLNNGFKLTSVQPLSISRMYVILTTLFINNNYEKIDFAILNIFNIYSSRITQKLDCWLPSCISIKFNGILSADWNSSIQIALVIILSSLMFSSKKVFYKLSLINILLSNLSSFLGGPIFIFNHSLIERVSEYLSIEEKRLQPFANLNIDLVMSCFKLIYLL